MEQKKSQKMLKGLNILKNTIIKPHYSEKNRKAFLQKIIAKHNIKYGIGIDCLNSDRI